MLLKDVLAPVWDIYGVIKLAARSFILGLFSQPRLLLRPAQLSDLFFSILWGPLGDGIDANAAAIKTSLITPNASGIVLDIGAGYGHAIKYLDRTQVTKYIALEPNYVMHERLRAAAHAASFSEADGTFILVPFGVEAINEIVPKLKSHDVDRVDTMISILSFCSVPRAQTAGPRLINRMLKEEGGKLLYYEHVRANRDDVCWWQDRWAPIWRFFFGGCMVGQSTDAWIASMGCWGKMEQIRPEGEEESIFPRSIGHFVRA